MTDVQSFRAHSFALLGADARLVDVTLDILKRLPQVVMVGIQDSAGKEITERVRSALHAIDLELPRARSVFTFSPIEIRKSAVANDLAVAVLGAAAHLHAFERAPDLSRFIFAGELSLAGQLRTVRGLVAAGDLARRENKILVCAAGPDADRAQALTQCEMITAQTLSGVLAILKDGDINVHIEMNRTPHARPLVYADPPVWSEVDDMIAMDRTPVELQRAIDEGRTIVLRGPRGVGKSMVAARIGALLPPMSADLVFQSQRTFDVAGLLGGSVVARPFRAPHHTISEAGMVGSMAGLPGEAALAHGGVLFLDEVEEFSARVLEAAFHAWKDGHTTRHLFGSTVNFPAQFLLVMSTVDDETIDRENLIPEYAAALKRRRDKSIPVGSFVVNLSRRAVPRSVSVEGGAR